MITIPASVMGAIADHLQDQYPEEGAGLLLGEIHGESRHATQALPVANRRSEAERRRRYFIDPLDLLEAERIAEESGVSIVGVYHSHPDHPARPSKTDLELAVPWYVYVITSITDGAAGLSTAWLLDQDKLQMNEVRLVIQQEAI